MACVFKLPAVTPPLYWEKVGLEKPSPGKNRPAPNNGLSTACPHAALGIVCGIRGYNSGHGINHERAGSRAGKRADDRGQVALEPNLYLVLDNPKRFGFDLVGGDA